MSKPIQVFQECDIVKLFGSMGGKTFVVASPEVKRGRIQIKPNDEDGLGVKWASVRGLRLVESKGVKS